MARYATTTAFGGYGEYVVRVEPVRQPDANDLAEAYGYIFPGTLAEREDLAWLPASAPERRSAALVGYFSTLNVPVIARKTGLGKALLSAWMDAVAPFNLEKIYLNSAPEDDADAAWLDKFYESAGWRPLEPRRGPHRWFVYHGSDDSKRIRMMGVDDLSMARPADIFERRTPTAIGPGAYAKRVLTHYARKTPERVRKAIASEITERYRRTARLDLAPITAAEVMRHLVAAASAQASREAPVAYGTQDADRVWEHRRNEILLDWGLASSMLPPRAM